MKKNNFNNLCEIQINAATKNTLFCMKVDKKTRVTRWYPKY